MCGRVSGVYVYVCAKIHTQRDKLEVDFRIDERCYVVEKFSQEVIFLFELLE